MSDGHSNRVQLDTLFISSFRNTERVQISPSPRFNVISGRNGMGKTNVIEAIYLLGALRSFRTSVRKELIQYGQATAKIVGTFGQSLHGLNVEVILTSDNRTVSVDGKSTSGAGVYFRTLPMVLFHPGNMELVQGAPETRRRFLDRALFQADAGYPELHRNYDRALSSRNMILRHRPVDLRSLVPFDHQLALHGSRIVAARAALLEKMAPLFSQGVTEVSGGNAGSLKYRPRVEGNEEQFLKVLEEKRSHDVDRGYTTSGPHADDIEFEVDGRSARRFASQGQQRTLVLAAKIAETRVLSELCNRVPLLLLDDVSSELDRDRNRQLFSFLATMGGQVFITTTHSDHIPINANIHDRQDLIVDAGRLFPA